ncbi:MAG: hypothetical protein ACR2RB_17105 [Gammaproteobacteria bacterium]
MVSRRVDSKPPPPNRTYVTLDGLPCSYFQHWQGGYVAHVEGDEDVTQKTSCSGCTSEQALEFAVEHYRIWFPERDQP